MLSCDRISYAQSPRGSRLGKTGSPLTQDGIPGLTSSSARAIPSFAASAWPLTPPPPALIFTSNLSAASIALQREMQPGFWVCQQNILYESLSFTVIDPHRLCWENTGYGFLTATNCIFVFHLFDFKLRPWPSAILIFDSLGLLCGMRMFVASINK